MPRPETPVARLVWVLDGEARWGAAGPNRAAADALVATMRAAEVVSEQDEAHLVAVSMLAEAVDADPTNAALWRQYRESLDVVKGLGAGGDDDAFSRFLAELGGAAVRHTAEPESADEG